MRIGTDMVEIARIKENVNELTERIRNQQDSSQDLREQTILTGQESMKMGHMMMMI